MFDHMSSYFAAEKQESLIFIVVGLLAMGLSVWLWMNGHRLKSMAYPMVVIALMQITVGSTVYLRTDSQLSTLSAQLQSNPAALKVEETARMQTVIALEEILSAWSSIELASVTPPAGFAFRRPADMVVQVARDSG